MLQNGSSINIIYAHCVDQLPLHVKGFVKPAISSVVRFAGQVVWLEGKISLPFTLVDYESSLTKTILKIFILIKDSSPCNMHLRSVWLTQVLIGSWCDHFEMYSSTFLGSDSCYRKGAGMRASDGQKWFLSRGGNDNRKSKIRRSKSENTFGHVALHEGRDKKASCRCLEMFFPKNWRVLQAPKWR